MSEARCPDDGWVCSACKEWKARAEMDDRSGDLYSDREAALRAGVPEEHVVELRGPKDAIDRISRRVRMAARNEASKRKSKRKVEKLSRRRNRG